MIGGQVQVSNHLVPVSIVGCSEAQWSEILGFDEDYPALVGDGHVYLGDALLVPSAGWWSVLLPEFEGKVVKGVVTEILSFDRLSQETPQPDLWVQVLQDAKHVGGKEVFAGPSDYEGAVRLSDVIWWADLFTG